MIEPDFQRLLCAYYGANMPKLKFTAESLKRVPFVQRDAAGQVRQAIYRDTETPGFGVRVGETTKAFFVEKRVGGRTVRHTLGTLGQITVEQARKDAKVKLGEMTAGTDPNAERRAQAEARAAAAAERAAAAGHTVKALCEWYVTHQRTLKKQSATDANGIFTKHVYGTDFARLPAKDLTPKQATALIRSVVEAGHKRTAAKLRAYLRAAYALAQGADTNAQAPAALVLFGIETNPIASTAAIKNATGARDVTLTEEELGEALRLLRERREKQHDDALAALELSLVLGGQRLAQVLRLTRGDVDLQARTITLLDPKGRRATARRHVLPLTDMAVELVLAIDKMRRAEWLFGYKTAATHKDTVARKGRDLLADVQANIAARAESTMPTRPRIEARDLRRTAETMLAGMGISKDVRAQLLSHGLGGVQDRHYDQHDYMTEKRNALQAWADRLQELIDQKPVATKIKRLPRAA